MVGGLSQLVKAPSTDPPDADAGACHNHGCLSAFCVLGNSHQDSSLSKVAAGTQIPSPAGAGAEAHVESYENGTKNAHAPLRAFTHWEHSPSRASPWFSPFQYKYFLGKHLRGSCLFTSKNFSGWVLRIMTCASTTTVTSGNFPSIAENVAFSSSSTEFGLGSSLAFTCHVSLVAFNLKH